VNQEYFYLGLATKTKGTKMLVGLASKAKYENASQTYLKFQDWPI
jgi:hypothetical protein